MEFIRHPAPAPDPEERIAYELLGPRGELVKAAWKRSTFKGQDLRLTIRATVVDVEKAKHAALAKLSPLDKLVLGWID